MSIRSRLYNRRMKRLYPDYADDEFNAGELKFIWGIKSADDVCPGPPCFWSMNDLDIWYDRKEKQFGIGAETIYWFKSVEAECGYYLGLLGKFTEYMVQNNYPTTYRFDFRLPGYQLQLKASSITELYTSFKIFVIGYCATLRDAEPTQDRESVV